MPMPATGDQLSPRSLSAQHFLYFLPLPQGQGSLRPTFGVARRAVKPEATTCEREAGSHSRVGSPAGKRSSWMISLSRSSL